MKRSVVHGLKRRKKNSAKSSLKKKKRKKKKKREKEKSQRWIIKGCVREFTIESGDATPRCGIGRRNPPTRRGNRKRRTREKEREKVDRCGETINRPVEMPATGAARLPLLSFFRLPVSVSMAAEACWRLAVRRPRMHPGTGAQCIVGDKMPTSR